MSENDQDNAPEPKKGPSHFAYQVNQGEDGKSYFNKVGSAFAHKDSQGFNILLDAMPINGKITLRTPQERLQTMKDGDSDKGKSAQERER